MDNKSLLGCKQNNRVRPILHVLNILEEGKIGGPQVRIIGVASALEEEIKTTIIMPKENSDEFRMLCQNNSLGFKVFSISRITKEWKVAVRYIFGSLFEIINLSRYFKKSDASLVHVSGGSWQFKGVIAGKLAGKIIVWHLNDTSMPKFIRIIFSLLNRYVNGFIFASERTKRYYSPLIKLKKLEFVIPPPVDTFKFSPFMDYEGDESLIQTFKGKIVISTVGNISPVKGVDIFIKAAAKLNDTFNAVEFIVIGPIFKNQHRYFKKLKELCELKNLTNIRFVGGRSDLRPLLKRSDIFVCSSYSESGPMSLWEAMSMEKPIISTDVGDVSLYVKHGESGYIIPVGDDLAMAGYMRKLINYPIERLEMGKKARKVVMKELDIKHCASKHIEAYNALATSSEINSPIAN